MYACHLAECKVWQAAESYLFPKLHHICQNSTTTHSGCWNHDVMFACTMKGETWRKTCSNLMPKPLNKQSTQSDCIFDLWWLRLWHDGQVCNSASRVSFWRRVFKPGVILHSLHLFSLMAAVLQLRVLCSSEWKKDKLQSERNYRKLSGRRLCCGLCQTRANSLLLTNSIMNTQRWFLCW